MLAAGAIAGSMALGAGAGALLFTPALSSAQSTTSTTAPDGAAGGLERHGAGGHGAELQVAAQTIGITVDQLRTELQGGKTIAEVAKAHDVDPQKVIDAIVAESTKRIDEAVTNGKLTSDQAAKLKANLSDVASHIVNDAHPPFGPRGGHRGFGPDGPDGTAPTGIGTSTS
jgi:hypothetical protein